MSSKKIFISHSSKDKAFASWLSKLLVCLGVNESAIFYSSDFRQGVREKISDEVLRALKETVLDIIILSAEYRKSGYCMNEAGIIWYKNQESRRVIIALPTISGPVDAGFINGDFNQHRLLAEDFLNSLCMRLKSELSIHGLLPKDKEMDIVLYNLLVKELAEYKSHLPIVENLSIPYVSEQGRDMARNDIMEAWKRIQSVSWRNPDALHTNSLVFYRSYIRQIKLSASDTQGQVRVVTATESIIVNLSDQEYIETYSSQFLRNAGGYDTFQEKFEVNGQPVANTHIEAPAYAALGTPYINHNGPNITIPAHSSAKIVYETTSDIDPERFFQSKVLTISSDYYVIDANLDSSFVRSFGNNYIFRSQFIPPDPHNLRNRVVPHNQLIESEDKQHIHYERSMGFPAGGGYVITLSRNKDGAKT